MLKKDTQSGIRAFIISLKTQHNTLDQRIVDQFIHTNSDFKHLSEQETQFNKKGDTQ